MRSIRASLAVAALGILLGAGSAVAATIVGTPRDDLLRGTPNADRLYGKGGDDRLVGGSGNDYLAGGPGADVLMGGPGADVLVGGPGPDRLVCGPGRDVARAGIRDQVGKDCEIVRGLPTPPPPPARVGTYCGATSQGMGICLDVEKREFGLVVAGVRLDIQAACEPTRQLAFTYRLTTQALVTAAGRFVSQVEFPGLAATVQGAFGPGGATATGMLRVHAEARRAGVDYVCDTGIVSWDATTPPPVPTAQPGRFCGTTSQVLGLCFDVGGQPKAVTAFELVVRFECVPPATLGISSTIPTAYAIRADGTFAFERIGTGTTAAGGSFTVTHAIAGTFDATGAAATGTLRARLDYTAPEGVRYQCESSEVTWSTQRQ